MSASSTPTLRPRSRKASARLTAVVDLPTPPLPDATAMIASTPGTPVAAGWAAAPPRAAAPCCGRAAPCDVVLPADVARSAVSATMADLIPGNARTAASAALRTGSHCATAFASTLIEKKTLPSLTTISESRPVCGSGLPSGAATCASAAATSSFPSGIGHPSAYRLSCLTYAPYPPGQPGHNPVDGKPDGTQSRAGATVARNGRRSRRMAKVAFLGLGVMGYPMARHLRQKGGH